MSLIATEIHRRSGTTFGAKYYQWVEQADNKIEYMITDHFAVVRAPRKAKLTDLREVIAEAKLQRKVVFCFVAGRKLSRKEFEELFPKKRMGMDGSVTGPSYVDAEAGSANRTHHGSDCDQEKCTCELVMDDLEDGTLDALYSDEKGDREGVAELDHLDQDNIVALYIFCLGKTLTPEKKHLLRRLVELEGPMDRKAGFHDLPDDDAKILKGIYEPIIEARKIYGWTLEHADSTMFALVIDECFARIELYLNCTPIRRELDMDYVEVGSGDGFRTIKQKGYDARMGLAREAKARKTGAYLMALPQMEIEGRMRYLYTLKIMDVEAMAIDREWLEDRLCRMESLPECDHGYPYEVQYQKSQHLSLVEKYFGGHEDVLANHQKGSLRDEHSFTMLLNFLVQKYREERKKKETA